MPDYKTLSQDLSNKQIDLTIERLGINGEGVAYHQGYTVFVDYALPGEVVSVKFYERHKTFGRAQIVKYLKTSPHRATPVCPLFSRCGGCQVMHLEYSHQLEVKRQRVVDTLERIGKLTGIEVLPCRPSSQSLGYRNKIQLPVDQQGRLGLFARSSHDIVEVNHCYIHCELGEKVLAQIRPLIKTCTGLRHVLIKTAVRTGQVLIIFVTFGKEPLFDLAKQIMKMVPEVKGVVQNVNASEGNVVLSGEFHLLSGQGYIEEDLLGLRFTVSAPSFFQVNPMQAELLYQKTLELANLTGREVVLDGYCGVGTLSLFLAKKAKEVIGIECAAQAILDAEHNARQNQISNVKFVCGRTEEFISTDAGINSVDVVILNPPRRGCERTALENIARLKLSSLIYISCDPATLARDLKLLCEKGFRVEVIQPFDMFPQTAHVETIVLLI